MDVRMSLIDHLEELRTRILKVLVVLVILFLVCFAFHEPLTRWLLLPADGVKLIFTSPEETFIASLRVAFLGSLYLGTPWIITQAIAFVFPGLTWSERRWVLPLGVFSFLLFSLGIFFSYYFLLPVGLKFLLGFGPHEVEPMLSIGKYLGFSATLLFATGLSFELPLVLLGCSLVGVVDSTRLRAYRHYAFLGAFVLGGVVTPSTDIFTQGLLAAALYSLYEVSIVVIRLARR